MDNLGVILVLSPDIKTQLKHLEFLFHRLREIDLKPNKREHNFLKAHILYLGHLISGQWVESLPEILQRVEEMPPPRHQKEVKQFLGPMPD